MRLYAPLYEGDSFLRPDAAIGAPVRTVFKASAPASDFVRSNIQVEAANLTVLDFHAIEYTARALRSIELGRLLNNAANSVTTALNAVFTAVVDWLDRNETYERDYFFATAENLADLENRQRHFERTGLAHY
jgi:hypothetical protein